MSFIGPEDAVATLTIERMIFHIVGPQFAEPDLLAEIDDLSPYADFFVERLTATLKGSVYLFNHVSSVRDLVASTLTDPEKFVPASEDMARRFQDYYKQDKRLAPGVLMFFLFRLGTARMAAIVKFDDKRVIAYRTVLKDGKKHPELQNILHTFIQERSALQKSAVIKIEDVGGRLVCIDRNGEHGDLTDRFRQFLDARREMTHSDMTKRIYDAVLETGRQCAGELSKEVKAQLRFRAREVLEKLGGYDPEKRAELVNAIFGAVSDKVHQAFGRALGSKKVLDEPVRFDVSKLPKGTRRIKETIEGVQVIYTPEDEANGTVTFPPAPGGKKRILIETTEFIKDDMLDDKGSSSR